MDPNTIFEHAYVLLAVTTLLSISLSLTKTVYSIILRNIDPSRQKTAIEETITNHASQKGFLETIAIGRIFCNTLIALTLWETFTENIILTGTPFVDALLFFIFICITIYLVCFLIPKIIAHLKPYQLVALTRWSFHLNYIIFFFPSRIMYIIFKYALDLFGYDSKISFLTDHELKKLDSYDPSRHGLEDDEKQMIKNIFEFGETPVKEIMTPRVEIVALEQNADLETTIEVLNNSKYSRIPIYQDNIDTISGILNTKDFLTWFSENREIPFDLVKMMMPPYFITREKKIDDLMRELRKERTHIAIVVDEFGGTSGIVTLEDILEEIVGEIYDENDENESHIEKIKDNIYFVNPMITLGDLAEELDYHIEEPPNIEVETLSGLILATLGVVPKKGTTLTIGEDIHIKILKIDGPRLEKVLLRIGNNE